MHNIRINSTKGLGLENGSAVSERNSVAIPNCETFTEFPSLDELLALVTADPPRAAGIVQGKLSFAKHTARQMSYEIAAVAFALADLLEGNLEAWRRFKRDPFWDGHIAIKHEHVFRWSFLYIYGCHHGKIGDNARRHARALLSTFDKRVLSAASIPKFIERSGGFQGLEQLAPPALKKPKLANVSQTVGSWDTEQDAEQAPRVHALEQAAPSEDVKLASLSLVIKHTTMDRISKMKLGDKKLLEISAVTAPGSKNISYRARIVARL